MVMRVHPYRFDLIVVIFDALNIHKLYTYIHILLVATMIDFTVCSFDPLLICNIIGICFALLRFLESNCFVGISIRSIIHTQPISELSVIDIDNTVTVCECRFEIPFGVIV